jgi:hypothetical protein
LVAKAYDLANNEGVSSTVTFNIDSNKETKINKKEENRKNKEIKNSRDSDEDDDD